ncbi:MAG: S1/P1 nuclease [Bacteriovoracaceae bacterium]
MKFMYLALFLMTFNNPAKAWGPEGHMIVGEIAENQLTPAAKKAVAKLLGSSSLAEVSTWADSIKGDKQWAKTKPWHYIDVDDHETFESIHHAPEGDVVTAITAMVSTLQSKTASTSDKQNALKFLVHFMGDIHQPLHVGRPDDHGGNTIKVTLDNWPMSLHQLWDSGMITKQNLDYKQYTHYLETMGSATQKGLIYQIPFKDMINESLKARPAVYDFGSSSAEQVTLPKNYLAQNVPLMNSRLYLGGKRLAELLNSIFN